MAVTQLDCDGEDLPANVSQDASCTDELGSVTSGPRLDSVQVGADHVTVHLTVFVQGGIPSPFTAVFDATGRIVRST